VHLAGLEDTFHGQGEREYCSTEVAPSRSPARTSCRRRSTTVLWLTTITNRTSQMPACHPTHPNVHTIHTLQLTMQRLFTQSCSSPSKGRQGSGSRRCSFFAKCGAWAQWKVEGSTGVIGCLYPPTQ